MKTSRASRALLALLSLSFVLSLPAQPGKNAAVAESVKLSNPDKPGTFRVDAPWADVEVIATDGDTISVESSLSKKDAKSTRADGLRRLDDQVSFELVEKDNVVSLALIGDTARSARGAEFKIKVPRTISLDLRTSMGGKIEVKNVEGDINIEGLNSEISLEGIVGATVVNSMNGEVKVVYAKPPQKPVSIASMNGEIELWLPADTQANVRLRSHNGSILTDFSEETLITKTESSGQSYNAHSEAARHAAREAAQAAREAVRTAVEIAREVSTEVQRAIAEESKGKSGDASPAAPAAPRAPTAPRAPRPPLPPIIGGKLVSGTLNGGGVDINISTMNGEITLRQAH